MTAFFQKNVDRRSRTAMVNFLKGHFRYSTASSWNGLTSYANNIKIHRLGLNKPQSEKAWEMLGTDFWDEVRDPIDDFAASQEGCHTICTNGRSGGYLVLHESSRELTGHLSYCPTCGQRNFKKVPPATFKDDNEAIVAQEILNNENAWRPALYLQQLAIQALSVSVDQKLALINRMKLELTDCSAFDACGVCRKPRRNFSVPPSRLSVSSTSIDQGEDFYPEEWSMATLRYRVDLVSAFDAACDEIRDNFIGLLEYYEVVEETVYRPVQVKTLRECA